MSEHRKRAGSKAILPEMIEPVGPTPVPDPGDPLAFAQALIEKEASQRAELCTAEVNEILKKYKCQMAVQLTVLSGRAVEKVLIVASPQTPSTNGNAPKES